MKNDLHIDELTGQPEAMLVPRPSAEGTPVTLQVVRDEKHLLSLRNEWDRLLDGSHASIYQSFDWLTLWWQHYGRGRDRTLHVIAIWRKQELVGLAPFFLEAHRWFGFRMSKQLHLMGCDVMDPLYAARASDGGPSDYLDIIVREGYEAEVSETLSQYFAQHQSLFDEIECKNLPEKSLLLKSLVPLLMEEEFNCRSRQSDVCPRIQLPGSTKEFLDTLDADVRRRLRRAHETFNEKPMHSITEIVNERDLNSAFRDLVRLHQIRWNGIGYLGLFADPRYEAFQEDVARRFLAQGRLWFRCAVIAGVRVGARLGFVFKNRMYDYLSGFDDRLPWSKSRPGLALLATMIDEAIQLHCTSVDLLRGDESYKFELTSRVGRNFDVVVWPPRGDGRYLRALARLVRTLRNIRRRVVKEGLIIQVLVKAHGLPHALRLYPVFFARRVFNSRRLVAPRMLVHFSDRVKAVSRKLRTSIIAAPGRFWELLSVFMRQLDSIRAKGMARLYLWNCDRLGDGARVRTRPIIQNRGRISVGENFRIESRLLRPRLATGIRGTISIGDNVSINDGTAITAQVSVRIGNRVTIGHSVTIDDAELDGQDVWYAAMKAEPVVIEDDVRIEDMVAIGKGVRIGRGTVVKKASVVHDSLPQFVVARGMPARIVRGLGKEEIQRIENSAGHSLPQEDIQEDHQRRVDSHFESTAAYWHDVYEDEGLEGQFYRKRLDVALSLLDGTKSKAKARVLEVGCGTGFATVELARRNFHVEAIDTVGKMVYATRERTLMEGVHDHVSVSIGNVNSLNYADQTFDAVFALGVIPWVHQPMVAIHEMTRVLKPGGYLVLTADNQWRLNHILDLRLNPIMEPARRIVKRLLEKIHLFSPAHHPALAHFHSIRQIDAMLTRAGMTKVRWRTVGFGPFTLWGRQVLSDHAGIRLHLILQQLADKGIPLVRDAGSHYVVLSRQTHLRGDRGAKSDRTEQEDLTIKRRD